MKINKIIIVGGGSAGWMSASALIKTFPDKEIIVIESPDVPRVGVGESTYDGINYFLEYLEIDRSDFFTYTDATIKVAIQFKDFYKKGDEEWCYPFGPPSFRDTALGLEDWFIKKYLDKSVPVSDFAESYFPSAHFVKHNTLGEPEEFKKDGYNPILSTALHFDAIKFADWLKNNYCIPRGVKLLSNNVISVNIDDSGVSSLILDNGTQEVADLYVDCTGFKSMILGGVLNEPFISYNDQLVNNSAWATQIQYIDKENELTNVTNCHALDNGWVWNIPLWSRIGTGYVYSDKFISDEDALEEFKTHLMTTSKFPRSKSQVDSLSFKKIKMRVGIHEKVWSQNVVAIGLSAGFIEPLESNGLFSVHQFLFDLVRTIGDGDVSQFDKDCFNRSVRNTFDSFVEFIKMHYALSKRADSEYWKYNMSRKFDLNITYGSSGKHINNLYDIKYVTHNISSSSAIPWIATGMNYMLIDDISLSLGQIENNMNYREEFRPFDIKMQAKKLEWSKIAKNSQKTIDFLRNKYYLE